MADERLGQVHEFRARGRSSGIGPAGDLYVSLSEERIGTRCWVGNLRGPG